MIYMYPIMMLWTVIVSIAVCVIASKYIDKHDDYNIDIIITLVLLTIGALVVLPLMFILCI